MTTAELHQISLSLGRTQVLRDIDLRISAGDRLVLMGPSGAGKSSLLRVLAGLVAPSAGSILLDGRSLSSIPPSERGIGLLHQDYALYPRLSVQKNLEVALEHQPLSKAEKAARVQRVVRSFEVSEILERLPSQISGGQAQRVAFAKAFVRNPRLLLLDEPLSQLDSILREQLIQWTLEASSELGSAICWVAHDPWEAFRVATRLAIMDSGRLIQVDAPQDIYRNPKNRRAADLCSQWSVNWIHPESQAFALLKLQPPREGLVVGVRPEDWVVIPDSPLDSKASVNGLASEVSMKVEDVSYLGYAWLAWGRLGDIRLSLLDRSGELRAGRLLRMSVPTDKLLWTEP